MLLLCLYGVLMAAKPSEPYLNAFLVGEKGFSNAQTNNEIFPFWSYGQLLMLLLVALLTERIGYKGVLVLESLAFLTTRSILLYGESLLLMQVMQVTYAIGTASKVVYFVYLYKCSSSTTTSFKKATAAVWFAQAIGQSVSAAIGQFLLFRFHCSLVVLNYISLVDVFLAFLVVLRIPTIPLTHHTQHTNTSAHFLSGFSSTIQSLSGQTVLATSIWIFATVCENCLQNYVQNLWTQLSDSSINNGIVTSAYMLFGALCTLIPAYCNNHAAYLVVTTFGLVVTMFFMAYSTSLYVTYICYILYGGLYYYTITIFTTTLAKCSATTNYAMQFGMNLFVATLLESVLTVILQTGNSSIKEWFFSFGVLQILVFIVTFIRFLVITQFKKHHQHREELSPLIVKNT